MKLQFRDIVSVFFVVSALLGGIISYSKATSEVRSIVSNGVLPRIESYEENMKELIDKVENLRIEQAKVNTKIDIFLGNSSPNESRKISRRNDP